MPLQLTIAGCNGAGTTTTAAFSLLQEPMGFSQFVNAGEIARGLSPFNPESVAFEAGGIMRTRIQQLLKKKQDFAIETTLSIRSYGKLLTYARLSGYEAHLLFYYLISTDLTLQRVAERVRFGGLNIPSDIAVRLYYKGLQNLTQLFILLCDVWEVNHNSSSLQVLIAKDEMKKPTSIFNASLWGKINSIG